MQNSKFLQFVSKISRGEPIIDDNQVKPAASGDWAAEYQQQYTGGPSRADEFAHNQLSHGPDQWVNEFSTEREQHGSVDDQWANEFSKLHVDDWVEEFGQQIPPIPKPTPRVVVPSPATVAANSVSTAQGFIAEDVGSAQQPTKEEGKLHKAVSSTVCSFFNGCSMSILVHDQTSKGFVEQAVFRQIV
ncbi:hypothetical protein LWI29_017459 [Acer saccharum]|uniref:Uncharacterized protein n=1 Tax=Acer saccharum TaxID=4024 RepID=A0AA39W3M1_ACESA|nr:hypothetical protein LWI29_017459 [Acer saccharum]